ncbi:hypothetical protein TDB9533_02145 [Thalassocella blandensis]|nr:hypothetical protein TDB9533_02145 [Thalassocella blandensis]
MLRLFIILLFIAFIAIFGGKYYIEQQIENSLDQTAQAMTLAGEFSYRDVDINHRGEIRINRLSFRPYNMTEATTIDVLAIRPGDVFKLFQLERDFRQQQLPEHLGLSLLGVEMPVTSGYEKIHAQTNQILNFGISGCGAPAQSTFPGLVKLGYDHVEMQMEIDYQIVGNGEHINISLNSLAESITDTTMDLNLHLGSPSRQVGVMAMAINKAQLNSLKFQVKDLGFETRLMEYCAKYAGLPLTDYYAYHVQAWQSTWQLMGVNIGNAMTSAYREFIEAPSSIELNLYPAADQLLINTIATRPIEALLYHLKGTVNTNNEKLTPLDHSAYSSEVIHIPSDEGSP